LDDHTDKFKRNVYFKIGDIVLDPFSGSGTTMTQASELGINTIGIDISIFNALISNCKVADYNISKLELEISKITDLLVRFVKKSNIIEFENSLLQKLHEFNNEFFPVPEYKYKLRRKEIDKDSYAYEKEKIFLPVFEELVKKYNIVLQEKRGVFLTNGIQNKYEMR